MKYKLEDVFNKCIQDINGPLIYKINNIKNNKCYIGTTIQSLLKRFCTQGPISHLSNYIDNKSNKYLYNSMNKHGVENFIVEILETNLSKEKMYELEEYYISKFDSYKNGYNNSPDGKGGFDHKWLDPDWVKWKKEHSSNCLLKRWKDPVYRINHSNRIKQEYKNNSELRKKRIKPLLDWHEKIKNNVELQQKRQEISRITSINKFKNNPELRKKMGIVGRNNLLKLWENNQFSEKMLLCSSKRFSELNKDPEFVKKRQLGTIKKVLNKLIELDLQINEENYNNNRNKYGFLYSTAIKNFPELINEYNLGEI